MKDENNLMGIHADGNSWCKTRVRESWTMLAIWGASNIERYHYFRCQIDVSSSLADLNRILARGRASDVSVGLVLITTRNRRLPHTTHASKTVWAVYSTFPPVVFPTLYTYIFYMKLRTINNPSSAHELNSEPCVRWTYFDLAIHFELSDNSIWFRDFVSQNDNDKPLHAISIE